jgi:uncharacterized protein (TIGR01777 family)
MRIVIAGGSGFLGRALSVRLRTAGHDVVVLTRDAAQARRRGSPDTESRAVRYAHWTPNGEAGDWAKEIDGTDALINLAGAGIADKRWSAARKRVLWSSRILSTKSLVGALRMVTRRPAVLIQGSAAGYYGAFENGPAIDESSPPGSDFLAQLCVAWEAEAQPAVTLGCRLVITRSSVVISRDGGALPKMMLPFMLFAGGPIGSGRQVMSWIHIDDWIEMMLWAIEKSSVSGPVNLAAPEPVTNAEFARALGRAMHRPSWMPVPGFALRLIVGEMANDALILGHRILPKRAQECGYVFRHPGVDEALASAVRGSSDSE